MKYQGFARKYRPKSFEDVIGQQEIATTLQNAIRGERIHHAYIFCGSRGVGKTSMARIFAKALNCKNGPTTTPCNDCELCVRIAGGNDVDVVEIDGASNRGIEEIRNIKENIKYLPSHARFKIFIIDEIHMLTPPAFNALLKTLEEPPDHAKFIFATTQVHSIPDTILSRCQRFNFKKITLRDIMARLQQVASLEEIKSEGTVLEKIAVHTGGAMRDSLVLLDQLASYTGDNITEQALQQIVGDDGEEATTIIQALTRKDPDSLLATIANFNLRGGNIATLIDNLCQQLRDIMLLLVTRQSEKFIDGTEHYQAWLAEQKQHFDVEFLSAAIYYLIEAKNLIHRSLIGQIILETTLLKILHMESLLPLPKIAERLYALEDRINKRSSSPRQAPVPPAVLIGIESESFRQSATPRNSDAATKPRPSAIESLPPRPDRVPTQAQAVVPGSTPPVQKMETAPTTPPAQPQAVAPDSTPPVQKMETAPTTPPAQPQAVAPDSTPPVQKMETAPITPPVQPQAVAPDSTTPVAKTAIPLSVPPAQSQAAAPDNDRSPTSAPKELVVAANQNNDDQKLAAATTPARAASTSDNPWENFISELRKAHNNIAEFLASYATGAVRGNSLVITLPCGQQFFATMMVGSKHRQKINELVVQCYGRPLLINFAYTGAESNPNYREIKSIVESDPVVYRALQLFEGRLVNANKTRN